MKKKKKISLFIIMFVIISLAVILFSNPLFMNKMLGSISGFTNYYDWGDLQSIDNDYSYSTLIYTENTKIYNTWSSDNPDDIEMTVRQDVIDDNDVDDDTITEKTNIAVFKIKEEDVSAGFVITNCAVDKDGNLLDAIVTVTAEELWKDTSFILFTLDRTYLNSGTQSNPDFATGIDEGITKKTIKENTPLSFFLSAENGRASVNLTYYKNLSITGKTSKTVQPANYNIGGASSTGNEVGDLYSPTIDYNNSPVATSITKVNSFYYDIDVPRTYANKLQSGREGVLSRSGQNNIYYKKDNDIAFNETITFNTYVSGLFINKNTIYSTGGRNINGIWYATSAEFLTSLPSSSGGSYDFDYIGSSCGLWFMFFSPMGYAMEAPTLEAPSIAYTGETWNYVSKQYIPNNYYSNIVDFHDVYSNFPKDNYINSFTYKIFKDSISNKLTANSSKLKDINGNNLSGKFYKPSDEEYYAYVPTSSATDYFKTNSAYNNSIIYTIPVVAGTPTNTSYNITNKSNVASAIGNEDSVSRDSNEVTTTIKSPYVVYDCETNGGTISSSSGNLIIEGGNARVYHNVEDSIDLSIECNPPQSQRFLGWATKDTISKMGDLLESISIPTAAELHAKENVPNYLETHLYAIYTKLITITARDESKVYDGTTLNATNGDAFGGGPCYADSGLQENHVISSCTYTQDSSITNYDEDGRDKKIYSVNIINREDGTSVTGLYNPNFVNAKLRIIKRNITVQAMDQQKHYDGTPLKASEDPPDYNCRVPDEAVEPNTLVSGHTITCESEGEQSVVGTGEKSITGYQIKLGENDVTDNYVVTLIKADLIVTDSLCPSAKNYTGVYDGNSHTITVGTSEGNVYYRTNPNDPWVTTPPERTDAGTTTVYMQAEKDGQVTTCTTKKINILKRNISVQAVSQIKKYDGFPLRPTNDSPYNCKVPEGAHDPSTLVSGHTITCDYYEVERIDAGGQGVHEKQIENSRIYNGSDDVTDNYNVRLSPADLVVTRDNSVCPTVTDYSGTYDGASHGLNVIGGSGGTIKYNVGDDNWSETPPERTDAGTTTVQIKVEGDNNHNDAYCDSNTITIERRSIIVQAVSQTKPYDGTPLIATEEGDKHCKLSSNSPDELVSGHEITCVSSGKRTAAGGTGKKNKILTKDNVSITDNGGVNTYTNNYDITAESADLIVTKVDAVCPTTTPYEGTYDGNGHTIGVEGGSGGTFKYRVSDDGEWSEELPERIDAGTTIVQIMVAADKNHNSVSCDPKTITINQRPIKYKADSASIVYDVSKLPLTKQSATLISGTLVDEHEATFVIEGSLDVVGSKTNEITSVVIMNGEDNVSTNYYIETEPGLLEILPATSTCPNATDYSGTYDGNSHTINVTGGSGGTIKYRVSDDDEWSETPPERIDAGTTTVQMMVQGDGNHDDETCPSKTITISPRPITIKATDQVQTYHEGIRLEATEDNPYTCTKTAGEELVDGDSFICNTAGVIEEAGEKDKYFVSDNLIRSVIIKDINLRDVTNNYAITTINGKLIITKVDAVCPDITNYVGIYDGDNHSITVGNVETGDPLFKDSESNEWSDELPARKDYGETIVNIKIQGDNNHNDVVCQNGKIKINQRPITVTTTDDIKEYDGEPLIPTDNTCSLKNGSSLANNERLTGCTTGGQQTKVGESDKTITSITVKDLGDNDVDLTNYDITYEPGKLIVFGEFEPTIVKEIISTKNFYRFNDTVRYKITITNNANYSIKNIKVRENNINAKFVDGTGYIKLSDQLVNVISINPLSSISVYGEYKVGKTETNKVDNEVEIISAESDTGATLKEEEYKDTATFGIQSKIRICKNISGVSIPNKFQFKVTGTENGFESDVSLNKDECKSVYVDPGKYKVTEIIPEEYEIVSVSGAITSNNGIINVIQGHDYEVTFTNKYTQKVYFHGFGRRENKVEGGE